jgi:hypothetical protein
LTGTPGLTGSVIGSISRRNRRSFAALAREKTTSALANLSAIGASGTGTLRPSASSGSLSKHTRKPSQISVGESAGTSPLTPPLSDGSAPSESSSPAPIDPNTASPPVADSVDKRRQTLQHVPTLAPVEPPATMHQTSSRLLRMTEDDRPFTKVRLEPRRITGGVGAAVGEAISGLSRETEFGTDSATCRISWISSPR